MSESPDHLDPKEATEARLCAYLEGELPPQERVEIEQYLAANPQHRKLLSELAMTRDWMRAIPSESAPSDLAESFQGQVERNMLLDDSADIGSGLSVTRWSQYAMIAAIVVLTVGLGITLVIMLKAPTNGAHNLSIVPPPAATEPSSTAVAAEKALTPAPPTTTPAVAAAVPTAAAPVTPAAPTVENPVVAAVPHPVMDAEGIAKDTNADEIKARLAASGYRVPGEARAVCFVVKSDAPLATNEQVQGFFTRHQLLVEAPNSLMQNNVLTSNSNNANQTKQSVEQNAGSAQNGQAFGGDINHPQAPGVPSGLAANGQAQNSQNQAADDNRRASKSSNGANSAFSKIQLANTDSAAQAQVPTNVPNEQLFVAHGLTPLQLELLSASLAADNPGQTVQRVTLSEGSVLPRPTTALAGLITKGQSLTVTVAQLVGPGIDKTNVVKVADDGTINLPMLIDSVPAVGVSATDLEARIAAKYREANLISDATVTVAVAPTTQPTTQPATQPVAATTQPVEPGIDVVVLVEKSAQSK